MQVELRMNGRLQIRLKATTPIEQVILDAMLAKAQNGQPVALARDDACAVVSVEGE